MTVPVRTFATLFCALLLAGCSAMMNATGVPTPAGSALRVSDNGRYLVYQDGEPFFWLGDTSWNLFRRSRGDDGTDQPPVTRYLAARARQGFTVVQAALVGEVQQENEYGQVPFEGDDFSRPRVLPGKGNDFWDYVDYVVEEADRYGLVLAILPVWLNSVETDDHPLVRTPEVAYRYGHFLGSRYRNRSHIVWVMGGDAHQQGRDVDNPMRLAMTRALAEGLADGTNGLDRFDRYADYSTTLMSYHPKGGNHSSSEVLHREPWLDFNMIQTTTRFEFSNYETVARDYAKTPVKPTLDSEVAYENSLSLSREEPQDRRIGPWEVRRAAYWNVFSGGFGHTYGHRSFIQWTCRGENTGRGGDVPWFEQLDAPGALQMRYLRTLIETWPFLTRIPDSTVITAYRGTLKAVATRDAEGSYALVYLPSGEEVSVHLDAVSGDEVRAAWFDPREGRYRPIGAYLPQGTRSFMPPTRGDQEDWVLVLEGWTKPGPPPPRYVPQIWPPPAPR